MARQVQLRRGTTAENNNFTGAIGEVTIDTDTNTLRVHDGITPGGTPLARASDGVPTNADYVVAFQAPTAANGYTWYRKYKSGWVEQGGIGNVTVSESAYMAVFPIKMRDANYTLCATSKSPMATSGETDHGCHYIEKTSTMCRLVSMSGMNGNWITKEVNWHICGFCAN